VVEQNDITQTSVLTGFHSALGSSSLLFDQYGFYQYTLFWGLDSTHRRQPSQTKGLYRRWESYPAIIEAQKKTFHPYSSGGIDSRG